MSTKAAAIWEPIETLPPVEQGLLWQELARRVGQTRAATSVVLHGEPLTDDDIAESSGVTFHTLDEEEKRAQPR